MQSYAPAIEPELVHNTVGKTLNRIRLEQGHSLEDVTKSTKIRTHFLLLLEEDNFNDLPDSVFTIGFIRNYCEYLNISAEPLISQYFIQSSQKETDTPFKLYIPQQSENIITSRVIFLSIFIIFIASILWYTTKNKNIINIPAVTTSATIISPQKKLVDKKHQTNIEDEKELDKTIEGTENTDQARVEPVGIYEPNNDKTIVKNEAISPITSPFLEKTPISESAAKTLVPESKDFNIEAIDETWLKITNEQGVRLKVSFLKKGEIFSLQPYQGNLISVGNAENVDFVQGNIRIKGSEYLGTVNGFAESKKIIAPQAPDVIQSLSTEASKNIPSL